MKNKSWDISQQSICNRRDWKWLLLVILPLLLVVTGIHLNKARGPFWLGTNLDPEYVYLLNSLNLATWNGVGHIDHPGTTVQVVGALVIRAVHFFQPSLSGDLASHILQKPELYLNSIRLVFLVLNGLMLLVAGFFIYRNSPGICSALWIQASMFFSGTLLEFGLTRVTPEPLLFFTSMVLMASLAPMVKEKESEPGFLGEIPTQSRFYFWWLGLVIGFGIATKITFTPLLLIPLVMLWGVRTKIYYLLVVVGSFVLFTLPIIRMYPRFFQWVYGLFTHSGKYGSGPASLVSTERYFQDIRDLLLADPFFLVALVSSVLTLLICFGIKKIRAVSVLFPNFRLLVAIAIVQVISVLLVAKHASPHYLLPLLVLSGFSILITVRLIMQIFRYFCLSTNILKIFFLFPLVFIFMVCYPPGQLEKRVERLSTLRDKQLQVFQWMNDHYSQGARVFYYTASSPEYALKFGCDLSRSIYASTLDQLYPRVFFYDIWTRRFSRFDINQPIPFSSIQESGKGPVVIQGTPGVRVEGLKLDLVFGKGFPERIFLVK